MGKKEVLQVLLENGCELNVCDEFGRTPLHNACWAVEPSFEIVRLIVEHSDIEMFHLADSRGFCPLQYVRQDHFCEWIDFLGPIVDKYGSLDSVTSRALKPPNSLPIPDPANALHPMVAQMVVSGRLTPGTASLSVGSNHIAQSQEPPLVDDENDDDLSECDGDNDCSSGVSLATSFCDDDISDSVDSNSSSLDDDEIDELLQSLPVASIL